METEVTEPVPEPRAAEVSPAADFVKPPVSNIDWRLLLKRVGASVAAIAAVGAVLSGLTGYWSTYKTLVGDFLAPKSTQTVQAKTESSLASIPRLSIVVLPFVNMSGDASQDFFADGLVENVMTDLSTHLRGLLVIGRGSAFTYKGKTVDIRQVGRELGVRYVVQGSFYRSDKNQIRVSAQLADAESGTQLWAERFDGNGAELLTLQDQLTARIANSLGLAMIREQARLAETRKNNPDAVDMVFRATAVQYLGARSSTTLDQAEGFYRKALAIEPDNADAINGLSSVLTVRLSTFRRNMSAETIASQTSEAWRLVDRGLALQPNSAEAHCSKGRLYGLEKKWHQSVAEHELARELDPNDVVNLNRLALAYSGIAQVDKAIDTSYDALRRSPTDPNRAVVLAVLGLLYVYKGQWDEAIEVGLKARPQLVDFNFVHFVLAAAYAQKGDVEEAKASLRDGLVAQPNLTLDSLRKNPFSLEKGFQPLLENYVEGLRKAGLPESLPSK